MVRRMAPVVPILVLLCLLNGLAQAQQTKKFENGVYFLEHLPPGYNPAGTTLYPIIIFLHGLGERSDTGLTHDQNLAQLDRVKTQGPPYEIDKGSNMCFTIPGQPERCFIVLSPQRDKSGTSWDTHTQKLIEYAQATYKVDPNRIYITGLSQGGFGTMEYVQGSATKPWATQFAAAAVAAGGGGNMSNPCIMNQRNIEFWEVHGTADPTVSITPMLNFLIAMLICIPKPLSTLYAVPGAGHNVWKDFYHTSADASYTPLPDRRYSPNVYEWFLMNPKNSSNTSPNQAPVVIAGADAIVTGTTFSRQGTASDYDGNVLTLTPTWTQIAGPMTATISQSVITTTSNALAQRTINVSNMNVDGVYRFKLTSTDALNRTGEDIVEVTRVGGSGSVCSGTGSISREQWDNAAGSTVSTIPLNVAPTSTGTLALFEGPTNSGSNYGARIRGYICAPFTGSYTFWIASDDQSELWISTDDNPAHKVLRASDSGYTGVREWTRYPSQASAPINLIAGQRYYIEALHKEGYGNDHLAVGWQMPNGVLERPIGGNRLMPFTASAPPPPSACAGSGAISREQWDNVAGNAVSTIPLSAAPTSSGTLALFEGPTNAGSNYGARIRGYVCAPLTGGYTFWIASDDASELWISTDDNPANKVLRASDASYTGVREWARNASQTSVPINLVAGQRYYIEALHKEGYGNDHIAVGWQLPNGTLERPIPGSRLSPFGSSSGRIAADEITPPDEITPEEEEPIDGPRRLALYPNPVKDLLTIEGVISEVEMRIYNVHGVPLVQNFDSAEDGTITVNTSALSPGIYFLILKSGEGVERFKFVKE